jgi:outer membrane protein assembly factor BamB
MLSTHRFSLQAIGRPLGRGVLLLAVGLLTGCAGLGGLNPMSWFGDEEVNPPKELQPFEREVTLLRLWSVNVGNGQGDNYTELTPAIDGDRIYAASEDGDVLAINRENGDVVWRSELRVAITGGVGAGGGLVLVGTEEAEVLALDQTDGEVRWRSRVSSEVLSAPQTNGRVVVAQTVDDKLVALEADSGERRWIYESNLPPLTLRGTSRPLFTSAGTVVAGFSNGTLVAVNLDDGVFRWEERVAVPEGEYDIDRVIDVDGDLVLDGNRVLASSYQGNIMAFDSASGRIVWGHEASSYHGIDIGFGNIYYSDDRGHLVAVRDNSNDITWENDDLEYRAITAPTAVGNYVAVADFEGYIHLISQIDGRIVGRYEADGDGVRSNLLFAGGTLYVYGNSGRLSALRIQ